MAISWSKLKAWHLHSQGYSSQAVSVDRRLNSSARNHFDIAAMVGAEVHCRAPAKNRRATTHRREDDEQYSGSVYRLSRTAQPDAGQSAFS